MRRILTAAFLVGWAGSAAAQGREHAPLVLQLPADTRALAMGGAFALGSADASSLFYNPALSAGAGISLGYQRYGGNATTVSLAGGAEWLGGRVGLGLLSAEYGVSAGSLLGGFGEGAIARGGGQTVAEHVAVASYARRIKGLRLAVAGKLIDQRAAGDRVTSAALDLSTGVTLGRINLGLAAQNLGPDYDFLGLDVAAPTRVTLGGAFSRSAPVGPFDVLLAAALTREANGDIVPGGGVELGYWPIQGRTFFARFGVRDPADADLAPWTVGAGFAGDRITLDWAFHTIDGADASHRFTLRFR